MKRKILLIYDDAKKGSRFDFFKVLINSQHDHIIKILIINYSIRARMANPRAYGENNLKYPIIVSLFHNDFAEYNKIDPEGFQLYLDKKPIDRLESGLIEGVVNQLEEEGMHIVDKEEFFIEAINSGYEVNFL